MLYNVITDEWGTTYVPTTLGNTVLAAIFIALLCGAVFFARKYAARQASKAQAGTESGSKKKSLTAKQIAFCAMSIALGTVLSNLKLFDFPFGGSITLLSMLVICLPGYFFGIGAGLLTGAAYGVLQLIIDPYVLYPIQLIVDYLLAFGALGLSGLFTNAKYGLIKGYIAGIIGRYVFTVISGWIFFGEYAWEGWAPLPYSLAYNGCYIFAEAAITIILLAIPAVRKSLARIKAMAIS